jgi:hypothetical protein
MKKLLTLLLLTFIYTGGFSQPSITSSFNPVVGDNYKYHPVNTIVTPGNAGANVTWDFGAIAVLYNPFVGRYHNPAATPYAADFPTATVAFEDHFMAGTYHYYKTSGTKMEKLGEASVLVTAVFAAPFTMFTYPFTYNTTTTGNYTCTTAVGSLTLEKNGTWSATGDAYGTLILPSGIHSNVLRIKTHHVVDDVYSGGSGAYKKDITEYLFVIPTSRIPLLKITSEIFYSGGTPIDTIDLVSVSDEVSGLGETPSQTFHLKFSPNPTAGNILMEFELQREEKVQMTVYSPEGRMVRKSDESTLPAGRHEQQISLEGLLPGVYLLRMEAGSSTSLHRIIRI